MYSTLESEETCIYGVNIPPRGEKGAGFEYTHMLYGIGCNQREVSNIVKMLDGKK